VSQIAIRWLNLIRAFFFRIKYKAFDYFGDAVFVADSRGAILYCNPVMAIAINMPAEKIIGLQYGEIAHETDYPAEDCLHAKMQTSLQREKTTASMNGRWFEIICDPVVKRHRLAAVIHTVVDITWYVDQKETLRQLAINDPLTGLFNRRYMEDSLKKVIQRSEMGRTPVGFVMLDLDHFKRFNDDFGHDAGDVLLARLGKLLMDSVRPGDIACRYGGEEFLLILPGASKEAAWRRAEKILEAVKKIDLNHRGNRLGEVTISAGVAIFPEHGKTASDVIHAADQALYRAKREGRNRVAAAE
jgi:diguanylate cyclase (GGDEF)-like protein